MPKGKKFDICIQNPPYDKNLHLRFLEKTIQVADTVISIQPGEFILRPYIKASWKKLKDQYKESIGQYINELVVIPKDEVKQYFDAGIDIDLCIFKCNQNGGFDYDNFYKQYDIIYQNNLNKFNTGKTIKDKIEIYSGQKYFVPIRKDGIFDRWWTLQLINYLDIIKDGKIYSGEYKGLTITEARLKNPHENPRNINRDTLGIPFNTLEEAINFRDSLKTEAYLYIVASLKTTRSNPLDRLPLFNSYKEKWTNEKIFNLFNIDNNKRNIIIELMQPFMKPTKNFGDTLNIVKKELDKLNNETN